MNTKGLVVLAALALAGCASFDGSGLAPGRSTAKDVEAAMGMPAEQLKVSGGDSLWFYPKQPYGRRTYAVRVGSDGVVRSVEQVLTEANFAKIAVGVTTRAQVRELLGPPYQVVHYERLRRETWTYAIYSSQRDFFLHVQMSDDGLVREVIMLEDRYKDQGDGRNL